MIMTWSGVLHSPYLMPAQPVTRSDPQRPPSPLPSPLLPILLNILTNLQVTDNESSTQLPPPETVSRPVFTWGNHSATAFSNILEATYSEVVYWRRNSFTLPFGKAGREFVREYQAFAFASALESIALKAATVPDKPGRITRGNSLASLTNGANCFAPYGHNSGQNGADSHHGTTIDPEVPRAAELLESGQLVDTTN